MVDWLATPREQILARAEDFTVILSSGEDKLDAETIRLFPRAELIAVYGAGYDGVDVQAATECGVRVSNTPDVVTDDVADLAIGFLIMLSRRLKGAERFAAEGKWPEGPFSWSRKVTGSTVGIVGMGRIGRAIAHRLGAFDVDVHYSSRSRKTDVGYTYHSDLVQLAEAVDTLIIAAPGGSGTRKLIGRTVLDALGSRGRLINVSRGSLIDQDELVSALDERRLGRAALDVFDGEPYVPKGLLGRDDVVATPHVGTATWETRKTMADLVAANIRSWTSQGRLLTPVN